MLPKDKNGKQIELSSTLRHVRFPLVVMKVVPGVNDEGNETYYADGGFIRVELIDQWANSLEVIDDTMV